MNKKIFQLTNISASLFLAGALLFSNYNAFATSTISYTNYSFNQEFPKPQYQNKLGTFVVDMSNVSVNKTEFTNNLVGYFGLDQQNSFKLIKENHDPKTGFTTSVYQHFYNDIKVNGDLVFVHSKEDKISFVNGQVVAIKNLSTSNLISNEKLNEIVYDDFGRKENVKESNIETYIYKQEVQEQPLNVKLVYKINITVLYPLKSIDYIVDAATGQILSQKTKIHKIDTPSTSATYYRGSKSITVDSYNGSYRLMDNARKIRTLNGSQLNGNLNTDGTFSGFSEYTNSTANYTSTNSKPAVEVHWAMIKTYDYYNNIHNRLSFDSNGHSINNYYDAGGLLGDDENAAALDEVYGGDVLNGMFYGKGGSFMYPVVALDVAGHEFSHMVVSRNGNGGLDYENESGALNESFADIFGTAIEFYVNDNPNWTMGEGIFKNNVTPNHFRDMGDPNKTPVSAGAPQQPDTYKGNYWQNTTNNPNPYNDNGGVHINSGVGNHWFYLLSVGGSGVNDLGNNYYVDGITIQKAEKIAYKALTSSLTPSATYLDAFNATKIAAATLYGANSNEWNQVVNAWYAVGIGNAPASNKNYEMQSKLKVYPNPASDGFVMIESKLENNTTVEMFDLTGKKVLNQTLLQDQTTINVSAYKTGMYILKFKSSQGEYSHKLMIK